MHSTVIIGSGLAGYTLAKEMRELAPQVLLHIISHDDGAHDVYAVMRIINRIQRRLKGTRMVGKESYSKGDWNGAAQGA